MRCRRCTGCVGTRNSAGAGLGLQPRLNIKLTQRQVLTPGLVQMVSVLALNKLELKEMLNSELVENPVLEEIDESTRTLEELDSREAALEMSREELEAQRKEPDPFEEIDFGSYFQDFLDPGYRTGTQYEELERTSFEHFLSQPTHLSDYLSWQLSSIPLSATVRVALEILVGNLNDDGYLSATEEELFAAFDDLVALDEKPVLLEDALAVLRRLDPVGVGARDLRECLLLQLEAQRAQLLVATRHGESDEAIFVRREPVIRLAEQIVSEHLLLLQRKDTRELVRLTRRSQEMVDEAVELIRRLDPRPGQRYNQAEPRLIEPDVAFAKRDGEWVVVMNEEDMPALRLSRSYRQMLRQRSVDREVREYVKERYKSAIQLLRNIEQRKNTIVRVCEAIVRRQQEFLDRGVEGLRPMMIKEVAEEIGVHPSTVSRAVSNKYVYTPQGVYELRFFFSEGVNGPEGGDLPLTLLKRRVRKLIEEEDPRSPLTDEQLAAELQRQGIQVTRRTVAKYREDLQIPSTHQRRQR